MPTQHHHCIGVEVQLHLAFRESLVGLLDRRFAYQIHVADVQNVVQPCGCLVEGGRTNATTLMNEKR